METELLRASANANKCKAAGFKATGSKQSPSPLNHSFTLVLTSSESYINTVILFITKLAWKYKGLLGSSSFSAG